VIVSLKTPVLRFSVPRKVSEPETPVSKPVPVTLVDVAWNEPRPRSTVPSTFAVSVGVPAPIGENTIGPLKDSVVPVGEPAGAKVAFVVATWTPTSETVAVVWRFPWASGPKSWPAAVRNTGAHTVAGAAVAACAGTKMIATTGARAASPRIALRKVVTDLAVPSPRSAIGWLSPECDRLA